MLPSTPSPSPDPLVGQEPVKNGDTPADAAPLTPVAAPDIPDSNAKPVAPFFEALQSDPSIKRCGKFHCGRRTLWWAVSYLGFGTTMVMDGPGAQEVSRLTFVEVSRVQEGMRRLHRVVLGRLILFYGS